MKNFLRFTTILLCLFSIDGIFAQPSIIGGGVGNDGGGPKQSWSDIYKNPNLSPSFPRFNIEGRMIAYNNLCLLGERVRTKYKHVVKQDLEFKILFDYLITDRVRIETICRREEYNECIEWVEIVHEVPVHSEIEVKERRETPAGIEWVTSFKKDFELQECLEF